MGMMQKALKFFRPTPFKTGCLVVLVSCLLFKSFGHIKPAFLTASDNQVVSAMFRWRGHTAATGNIVIIDIDEKSLYRMGQWPWPRTVVADLIKKIHHADPKAIGIDIVFAEKDRTSPNQYVKLFEGFLKHRYPALDLTWLKQDNSLDNDLVLGNVVAEIPVVLGYVFQTENDGLKNDVNAPFPSCKIRLEPQGMEYNDLALFSGYRAVLNVDAIAQAETEGFFNVFPDPSGTVRKVPLLMKLDGMPYPSLALEVLRLGLGETEIVLHGSEKIDTPEKGLLGVSIGNRFIPTDDAGQLNVNYRGPGKTFPYLSAVDILDGKHAGALNKKYVLIGTSAAGLSDLRATPFSSTFPGVEVHATVIDNILSNDPFTYDIYTEIGITYTLIAVGGILLSALLAFTGPLAGSLGGILFIGGAVICNYQFFFLQNKLVGISYPMLTVTGVFIMVTIFNYFVEDRQKRFIHGAFSHYVSPQVVNQLVKSPDQLTLRGEERNLTVLFADIRNFTNISEKMDSQHLGLFMNRYLTAMGEIIMHHQGMVDKFIGDAIMAIWGAPLGQENHAENAVRASIEMVGKLAELQNAESWKALPTIRIGIGINTGMVSVGNFGSDKRFDYTVIGDAVNLASRIEGLNKIYGTGVIISEFTRKALGDRFAYRFLDMVRVKGKEKPVKIYEPLQEGSLHYSLKKEIETFDCAVQSYQTRKFDEAFQLMEGLYESHPSALHRLYMDRIQAYRKDPPPQDWNGVSDLNIK
jgi:adenylate cyclase